MRKTKAKTIIHRILNDTNHFWHKEGHDPADFGMNNSPQLLEGGFGLYSFSNTRKYIPPANTHYYRIALIRSGRALYTAGIDAYALIPNSIVFGFPGQVVSLRAITHDFLGYYMLFSDQFIDSSQLPELDTRQVPFFGYAGMPVFQLEEAESIEVEKILFQINNEIKAHKENVRQAVQLYIQLILVIAKRRYEQLFGSTDLSTREDPFLTRYLRLVSEHYLSKHKVADYAFMLHVSPDHLNRIVKRKTGETAHCMIERILLREAKALLHFTDMTIAEVGYKLGFQDPSYFTKFFKKLSGTTPLQFRHQSE